MHVDFSSIFAHFFCSDDILRKEDGPLLAAQIGSELQKQFAILPGWFDSLPMQNHKTSQNILGKSYLQFEHI